MEKKPLIRKALAELVIIIVGVLLAFQVENLRDAHEARSRERAALQALHADLTETLDRLNEDLGRQERSLRAQRLLLRIAEGHLDPVPPDSMTELVTQAILYQRLEAVRGSYDALVASGDLRLIRNDSVRASLAALFGEMGDGYEDEDLSTALRTELMMAISGTSDLLRVSSDAWRERVELPVRSRPPNVEELLDDARYRTALMAVSMAETFQAGYFRHLQQQIERVLSQLAREMAA